MRLTLGRRKAVSTASSSRQAREVKDALPPELESRHTESAKQVRELRKAQQQLERSRNSYALLYEHGPIAHVTLDSEGCIRQLNQAAAQLFGRDPRRMMDSPFAGLLIKQDIALFLNHLKRCRARGAKRVTSELRVRNKEGRPISVQLISTSLVEGGRKNFQTALIDLSEAQDAERARRQALEFADKIVETMNQPLAVVDQNLAVVSVNNSFASTFGLAKEQAKGRWIDILLNHWWGADGFRDLLKRCIDQNLQIDGYHLEADLPTTGRHLFLLNARRLNQERGATPLLLILLEDVTERRQMEAQLAKSQRMLAEAEQLARVGSWEWDLSTNVCTWSDGLFQVFGITGPRLKPDFESMLARVHPADRALLRGLVERAIQNGEPFRDYFRIILPDKQLRTLLGHGCVLKKPAGEPAKVFGAVQDVTELKNAESDLRQLNQELEQRVATRTKELQETCRQLESLTYTMAHDLRAPLRAIAGFSAALMDDHARDLNPQAQNYLDRIAVAACRMDQLLRDLLDYTRLTMMDLPISKVNLGRVLKSVLIGRADEIRASGAKVIRPAKLPAVWGHDLILEKCLGHLLSNALKFVAPGVIPEIRISVEQRGFHVRVYVQDNGIGIPARLHNKLFKVFERLHGQEHSSGTGIGLATVKLGIERLGGRVGVESKEGQGSCFWMELTSATAPCPPEPLFESRTQSVYGQPELLA
jgi:PAS domain S-box-containing protein